MQGETNLEYTDTAEGQQVQQQVSTLIPEGAPDVNFETINSNARAKKLSVENVLKDKMETNVTQVRQGGLSLQQETLEKEMRAQSEQMHVQSSKNSVKSPNPDQHENYQSSDTNIRPLTAGTKEVKVVNSQGASSATTNQV